MAPTLTLSITAVLSIIVGLLILFWPKTIRIVLGLYFLVIGVLNLLGIYLPGF